MHLFHKIICNTFFLLKFGLTAIVSVIAPRLVLNQTHKTNGFHSANQLDTIIEFALESQMKNNQ